MSNYVTLLTEDNQIDTSTLNGDGKIDIVSSTVNVNADGVVNASITCLPFTDVWRLMYPARVLLDDNYWMIRGVNKSRTSSVSMTIDLEHVSYVLDIRPEGVEENMDEVVYHGTLSQVAASILNENSYAPQFNLRYDYDPPVSFFATTCYPQRKRLQELAAHVGMYVEYDKNTIHFRDVMWDTAETGDDDYVVKILEIGKNALSVGIDYTTDEHGTVVRLANTIPLQRANTLPPSVNETLYEYKLHSRHLIIDDMYDFQASLSVIGLSYNPFDKSRANVSFGTPPKRKMVSKTSDVINKLGTNIKDKPLSAAQGTVLDDKITETNLRIDDIGGGGIPWSTHELDGYATYEDSIGIGGDVIRRFSVAIGHNQTTAGQRQVIIGWGATISGAYSTTVGFESICTNEAVAVGSGADARTNAVAVGYNALANNQSVAIGSDAQASSGGTGGDRSIAIGYRANVTFGTYNTAIGAISGGIYGSNCVYIGHNATGDSTSYGCVIGDNRLTQSYVGQTVMGMFADGTAQRAWVLGRGTSNDDRRNIYTIDGDGNSAGGTHSSAGADYAEMFEWDVDVDINVDCNGLAVTLTADKIRLAQQGDDVLGIVSCAASVLGDAAENEWSGMYKKDIYGNYIYDTVTLPDGSECQMRQLSDNYDSTKPYVPRKKRKEWAQIGLLGKIVARDDGSCIVGGYCDVSIDGILTASQNKTNMRVMKRMSDNHVLVFVR